jgi:hypothetical protein
VLLECCPGVALGVLCAVVAPLAPPSPQVCHVTDTGWRRHLPASPRPKRISISATSGLSSAAASSVSMTTSGHPGQSSKGLSGHQRNLFLGYSAPQRPSSIAPRLQRPPAAFIHSRQGNSGPQRPSSIAAKATAAPRGLQT